MATENTEEVTDQEDYLREEASRKRKRGRKKAGNRSVTPERRSERRKQQVTPVGRPIRERKTVERYSFSAPRRESTPKAVVVKQGPGTKLRDIPNVFLKLSKWKADESLHYLHKILFGKTAKANYVKRNIFQFSGFVWAEGEKKGKLKLREKLEKCVKGRLLEFCDVLDIPVDRATTKKEDLLSLLLDFLQSPHVTRDVIHEENEQSGKKRKRRESLSSEKTSVKKRRTGYKHSVKTEEEENQNEEKDVDEDEDDGNDADSEDNISENREDEDDDNESEQEEVQKSPSKKTRKSNRSIVNKGKGSEKEKSESKARSNKKKDASTVRNSTRTRKSEAASKPKSERAVSVSRAGSKSKSESSKKNQVPSIKKKVTKKQERAAKSKAENSRNKKGKGKASEETVVPPTGEQIRSVVEGILKEVDFFTTTSTDILRKLEKHFGVDLTNRTAEVKSIIDELITEMANDESDSQEEDARGRPERREDNTEVKSKREVDGSNKGEEDDKT